MKLARKLSLTLFLGLVPIIAVQAYVRIQRETQLFEKDIRRDQHQMARALALGVVDLWRTEGADRAMSLVQYANEPESEVLIRWVWLDATAPDPLAPLVAPERLLDLKASKEASIVHAGHDEERLVTYFPVQVPGSRRGCIEISESLAERSRYVAASIRNIVFEALSMVAIYGIIAMVFGTLIVGRPMNALMAKARRVGAGDLTAPLRLRQRDELGTLADEFNAMCERLKTTLAQLRHADRLATIGNLASGVAHELGTPLNVVSGHAQLIASGRVSGCEVESSARTIAEQAKRMAGIIRQLLDFARRREPHLTEAAVKPFLEHALDLLRPLARKRGVGLEFTSVDGVDPTARLDGAQIQQVLTNLVMNGIQASGEGGRVGLSLSREMAHRPQAREADLEAFVRIDVKDEGAGIAADDVPRIFEPFFTTKAPGDGTGLGLSVADGIVREHGGWISVVSEPGKGSVFSVHVPAIA